MSGAHSFPARGRGDKMRLLFGASVAPVFWLGQTMLSYGVAASACYGADHPTRVAPNSVLRAVFYAFDALAVSACLIGFFISYTAWRTLRGGGSETPAGWRGFLAMWGIFSSLIFLVAILANAIASVGAPLCLA